MSPGMEERGSIAEPPGSGHLLVGTYCVDVEGGSALSAQQGCLTKAASSLPL